MLETLDKIDRRLIYELDWNARQSETELAKKIGRSRETVRYRIAQLEKKGIISGYATWIDVTKLGYQVYKMYLKIGGTEKEREAFFTELKANAGLFWLGLADGAWDVGLTFFAKSNEDIFHLQNSLFARYRGMILQKSGGVAVGVYVHPKKLFFAEPKERRQIFGNVESNSLDPIDKRILSQLFHDSRRRLVALANGAGVSVDIVRSRIRRMEERGIIVSYNAGIDYQKLCLEFYKAFLYFDSFSREDEARLFEIAKQDPNILHVVTLISPWDVELEMMVENYQKFNQIIRRLKADFPNLRNVESATMYGDFVFPAEGTIMKL